MCPSDDDCVNLCLNGRPDSFRQLVLRYQRPVISYLTRRLGSVDDAEEVAQESFVRAYFQLNKLKHGDAFFSWLLGIAHRVMMEGFRRHRRERTLEAVADPVDPSTEVAFADDLDLTAAIARLPAVYQEVIILRYFGGLSCGEVAVRLGVPLGTVTKRLSRAYALLRETIPAPRVASGEVRS